MAQVAVTTPVKRVPVSVPGEGMAAFIRRIPQVVKSGLVSFGDTAAINLFELPGNIAVTGAWIVVAADFDGSGTSASPTATFSVPVATGAQIILDAVANTLVTSVGAQSTGPLAVTPASGGMGILNYTPGTTTAGSMYVYLQYVDMADML
jgi:hypothetical protein